ncbi:uncharacterized protein LOC143276469 isoform X1 [Babylonia areolata]|uniref:uncharacterized protein LOC143276469 isoform X1 n=1 Tax=Babylonia areolata TaxID=304850 RepID=UPI003FD5A691
MAAASDTDSLHDNMTRIRLKMVQRKLANERERLQQPESPSSDDQGGQWKLQQALLRRQQLLDRLKQEQDQRPRSSSPRPRRRSYTPSTLPPPPSRRSLPVDLLRGMSRAYRFNNWYNTDRNVAPQNYVVEHQVAQPQPVVARRPIIELPPIIQIPAAPPPPQVSTVQPAPTVIQQLPAVTYTALPSVPTTTTTNNNKGAPFNKADFMDMMMLQNAQMHHMVMQQMMLYQLPGNGTWKMPTAQVPLAPVRTTPVVAAAPIAPAIASSPSPIVHHMQALPPLEPRNPGPTRVYGSNPIEGDNNYFSYH